MGTFYAAGSLIRFEVMPSEGRSDAECVWSVQRGETDAFEVLVTRHQKAIFDLLYRLLGDYDEAAETAQEVFFSAYKSIRQFRGEANFSTWLYRIALNHGSTRRRTLAATKLRTVPLETHDFVGHNPGDPAETVEQREIQQTVQQALNSLEPDDAMIILLRDLQDVSYEDVARVLEIPLGTVKSRLHRARQVLKSKLAAFFYSDGKRP